MVLFYTYCNMYTCKVFVFVIYGTIYILIMHDIYVPVNVKIDSTSEIDFALIQSPIISSAYVETLHKVTDCSVINNVCMYGL